MNYIDIPLWTIICELGFQWLNAYKTSGENALAFYTYDAMHVNPFHVRLYINNRPFCFYLYHFLFKLALQYLDSA